MSVRGKCLLVGGACCVLLLASAAAYSGGDERVEGQELAFALIKDVETSAMSNASDEGATAASTAAGAKPAIHAKFVQPTIQIDGCPTPKLPIDFLVTDRWWQWVFTKDIKSTDEKTSYGMIKASPFSIPKKINYYDVDQQLVASIRWHLISFVGAHDYIDCKGKKLAESEEKIASKLFNNEHFSQFELTDANGTRIAESSKTKFFNHQIILEDPTDGRALIKINKNWMSLSNTWKVHLNTGNTRDHLIADPRIIALLAASQEGVPFMGWGSLMTITIIISILACCCGCFGCFKYAQRSK